MFIFVPLVAAVGVVAVRTFWLFIADKPAALLVTALGVLLFGASAVGLEVLGNLAAEGSLFHKALGFAEEIGEMVGVTLLLWGALLVARGEGVWLGVEQPGAAPRRDATD